MRLANVSLRGFRNHNDTQLEFGDYTNIILGDNGQGKTNILEAISYLCLTKSFYANSDSVVLGFGRSAFEVQGSFISDTGIDYDVRVTYLLESKEKVYAQNKRRTELLSSVIGRFPIVILSPENAPITFGAPSDRRRFLDLVMSQLSGAYVEDLLEYRRILRQRNKILFDARINRTEPNSALEPWDRQVVDKGSVVTYRRKMFIQQFQEYLISSYRHIVDTEELPSITYKPTIDLGNAAAEPEIAELLHRELACRRREEVRLGTSLVGPHRDETVFTINGNDLRKYASQGQHKTFLIALKMAEFFYLKEHRNETPIVLLDDIFSELDEHRAKRVLSFIGELGQSFITSTTPDVFEDALLNGEHHKKFFVSNGSVQYASV
jgi:DNA replication and repair protein RecF